MRIGIFGGTFDPPHLGHKKYADEFMKKLSLDKLLVMPTAKPPHKSHDNTASSADRLRMSQLTFGGDDRVEVSDLEISRGGKSYTYETVADLAEVYPNDELIFLLGSDMLLSFHTWKNPDVILKYVKICAVTRCDEIHAQNLREYIEEYFPEKKERFIICDFEPIELSSTFLREAVANGKSIEGLIAPQVLKYIKEKELYL